ncbi:TIGR03790 family protein [Puniceicoccaceae bacterium K14]|nr:TIGR03790 family protein [Puniceicoccaceae bacterium K14]
MMNRIVSIFSMALLASVLGTIQAYPEIMDESYYANLTKRTVIVANLASKDSVELASFYAKQREIPLANILYINCPDTERVSWNVFVEQIFNPIRTDLVSRGWIRGKILPEFDSHGRLKIVANGVKIAYLVTTYGVPFAIENAPGEILKDAKFDVFNWEKTHTTAASVDSELGFFAVHGSPIVSVVNNPYYERRNAREESDYIVKVSRIDGPSLAICKRIILDSIEAEQTETLGRGFIDLGGGPTTLGDEWLESVFGILEDVGIPVEKDVGKSLAGRGPNLDNLSFYFGWYAANFSGGIASEEASFKPGSIAFHIHSFSGKIRDEELGWTGPLLVKGAAVSVGNVNEPYLELTHRPDLLLKSLSLGWNVGDAMAYSLPMLSWQTIHIGDPLYRPFLSKLKIISAIKPD